MQNGKALLFVNLVIQDPLLRRIDKTILLSEIARWQAMPELFVRNTKYNLVARYCVVDSLQLMIVNGNIANDTTFARWCHTS